MKIKVGDKILVTTGKYKGKTGKVMRVFKEKGRVTVEKVGMRTRHIKKTANSAGQKIKYEAPIHISNVMLIDPKSDKPTRIGYKTAGKKKVRVAKKSGSTIEDVTTSKKKA